ncbi:MAG: hypothetical protein A2X36_07760 [Elusimicrobia bacterium GWA2_69_24]|nr:MAG: hypothetical protein A2X36_07760 [Elusimicrobia bacterium GWA2_69_24]
MTPGTEAAAVAGVFFCLGLWGMAPSVSFGDSGEFIAAAATLSVPHAPGYPLYCLLARAVGTMFPWATWAYRVNLLSVLCGAGAMGFFWAALRRARLHPAGALLGLVVLGLSPLRLHTSLQAEVFSLNDLFAAAAVWIFACYRGRVFQDRPMAALGLCLGLGGANHHTLAFMVPALLVSGWLHSREDPPSPARLARSAALLLAFTGLGLLTYAYLPLRARLSPPLDWGHPVDLQRFLHVLLRKDYGSFSLTVEGASAGGWSGLQAQAARYLSSVGSELGPAGLLLLLLGLFAAARRLPGRGEVGWHLPVLLILMTGPVFLMLGSPPLDPQTTGALQRFQLMSLLGLGWLAAVGGSWLASQGRSGLVAAALTLAAAPLPCVLRSASWHQRTDLAALDYGRNLLRTLPPRSLLFIDGGDDTFYTLAYLLYGERRRPDIEPHDRGGLVFPSPYGPDFRRLTAEGKTERRREVEAAAARGSGRPVFYSTLDENILPGFELPLWGLLRRVGGSGFAGDRRPADSPTGPVLWDSYVDRTEGSKAQAHYRYRALVPVYPVMRGLADAARGDYPRALLRLRLADALGPDVRWVRPSVSQAAQWIGFLASLRQDWEPAGQAFLLATQVQPEAADSWFNLGVTLDKRRRYGEAESAYLRGVALNPSSFQAYYNLGALYWGQGRWSESMDWFEKAHSLQPEETGAARFAERARRAARGEAAP